MQQRRRDVQYGMAQGEQMFGQCSAPTTQRELVERDGVGPADALQAPESAGVS